MWRLHPCVDFRRAKRVAEDGHARWLIPLFQVDQNIGHPSELLGFRKPQKSVVPTLSNQRFRVTANATSGSHLKQRDKPPRECAQRLN